MSTVSTMQELLPEFSKSERKIADHFIKYPYDGQRLTIEAAAQLIGVSRSSIIRFAHRLGFSGYSEFRYSLSEDSGREATEKHKALSTYQDLFGMMEASITQDVLDRAAETICRSNRVVTIGALHSSLSAKQMAFRLTRMGIDSHCIDDETIAVAYTKILKPGDTVIVFSISGQRYTELLNEFRRNRVGVILFTMTPESSAATFSDIVLALPSAIHTDSRYILDEAVPFFLGIELVVEAVYLRLHPSVEPASEKTSG